MCPQKHLLKLVKLQIDKKIIHKKEKVDSTRMRFKFVCCKARVYSCKWYTSKPAKTGSTYSLTKIAPSCKCNKALSSFRFITKYKQPGMKNPKTHIKYKCCSFHYKKMEKYKKVKSHTGWNDSGKGRNKYLSRHDIRCPKHAFLGGFRLKLQEKNLKNNPSVRFNYSCVLPSFKVNLNVQKKKKSKKRRKPINPMKHYQKKRKYKRGSPGPSVPYQNSRASSYQKRSSYTRYQTQPSKNDREASSSTYSPQASSSKNQNINNQNAGNQQRSSNSYRKSTSPTPPNQNVASNAPSSQTSSNSQVITSNTSSSQRVIEVPSQSRN